MDQQTIVEHILLSSGLTSRDKINASLTCKFWREILLKRIPRLSLQSKTKTQVFILFLLLLLLLLIILLFRNLHSVYLMYKLSG